MKDALAHSVAVATLARFLDGWTLLTLGVLAFLLSERRCVRANHWHCAVRVLGPMAIAAIVAVLTPNLFEANRAAEQPSGGWSGAIDVPSRSAAAGAAIAVVLFDAYGVASLWFFGALALAVAAWIVAGVASVTPVSTGLLLGAGTGMFIAVGSRRIRSGREGPGDVVKNDRL